MSLLDEVTSQLDAVNEAVGTHVELVAGDPLYAELAATQFLATAT